MLEMMMMKGDSLTSAVMIAGKSTGEYDGKYTGYSGSATARGPYGSLSGDELIKQSDSFYYLTENNVVSWIPPAGTVAEITNYDLYVNGVHTPWDYIFSTEIYWNPAPDPLKFQNGETYDIELR